jgi:predicted permease
MFTDWLLRLRALFRRSTVEHDIDDELRFHVEQHVAASMARGLDRAEAVRQAQLAFGGLDQIKEEYRDALGVRVVDELWRDLRLAVRSLAAAPIVSIVAGLSLALGIGANTAIFSIVNTLILRALPGVAEPARLVTLASGNTGFGLSNSSDPRWSYGFWKAIEARADAFDGAFAWSAARFNLSTNGEAQPVDGLYASSGFFKTLGVPAIAGRTFTSDDDAPGGGAVAVISYGFWQRRFAGSAQAIGSPLTIDRVPFTIVGVAAPGFIGTEVGRSFDVAVSLGAESLVRGSQTFLKPPYDTFNYWLLVALRLKPGQSVDAATAALRAVQPQIREAARPQLPQVRPFEFLNEPFTVSSIGTGVSPLRRAYQRPLLAILLIVGLVLFVACANIANLQAAKATARRHELSVRRALGATPWQLVRQLLVENLLLASAGALAGLLIAAWGSRLLVAQLSTQSSAIALELPLDWRVLAFTMTVTVTCAIVFGIAPAFLAARVAPIDAIKAQGRGIMDRNRAGLSGSLVVLQVALSLVLVVFAQLFVGTFQRLASTPLGFDRHRVLVTRVETAQAPIAPADRGPFFHRLVAAVSAVPGVEHAAASQWTPIDLSNYFAFVRVPGAPPEPAGDRISAKYNFVTPGWFAAYGIPLRAGRDFDDHDVKGARPVLVVNDTFARRFLPDGALEHTVNLTLGQREEFALGAKTIVGVVGDSIYMSLRQPPPPTMYMAMAQWDFPIPLSAGINISIRAAAGPPSALAPQVTAALTGIEKNLTVRSRSLDVQVDDSYRQERIVAMLSGSFAALALLLAGLGLYGVTAYAVVRRRTEIGIRIALGAVPASVIRLVVARVVTLVGVGAIAGIVVSLWLSRFVAALLYGLGPRDPIALVEAVVLLAAVAVVAASVPAKRAAGIDPAAVLRES